jgi:hypothetical protein
MTKSVGKRKKLLSRGKRDILLQPKKVQDEEKMTAKELERTQKWRDMAIVDNTNRTLHYRFPITKKVRPTFSPTKPAVDN